jgi:hypothetical protein
MRKQALCPGRDAARSSCEALLRRTGTAPNTGVRYGPGSAAHRSAKGYALHCVRGTAFYIKCTECGASRPINVKAMPTIASTPDIQASTSMPVMMVADASTMPIWKAAEATS